MSEGRKPELQHELKPLFALGMILLYTALISAILFNQQKASPFSDHPVTDEEAYIIQAKGILDGSYPGEKIFYQSPLYPYFLATVFYFIGENYNAVRAVQSLFMLASIAVMYFFVRRFFGTREGLIAAAIMALYGPILNYQVLLLKVSPFLLFLCLFFLISSLIIGKPDGWWRWLILGTLCSFLLLLYDVMQLFLLVVPLWTLFWFRDRRWKWKIAKIAIFLAGAALIVAPLLIRNKIVADEWVISTSQGGANFFIGNNPIADGRYTVLPFVRPHPKTEEHDFKAEAEKRAGHALKPTEISGFWFKQGFIFIKNNPAAWLSLVWKKIRYFFNDYEIPDNHGFTFDRAQFLHALYLAPLSFGIIFPFAVFGIVATRRKWRSLSFIYVFLITFTVATLAFFIVGRYRIPVVIGLIPFAASGINAFLEMMKNREIPSLISALVIIAVAGVFSFLPTDASHATWATEYYLAGNAYLKDADKDYTKGNRELAKLNAQKAKKYFDISLQINPRNENAMKSLNYAEEILGSLPAQASSSVPAAPPKGAATLPSPPARPPVRNQSIDDSFLAPHTLTARSQYEEAITRLKQDIASHPENPQAYFQLGLLLASREEVRDFNEATKYLKKALEIDPKMADAWNVLGNIAYLRGNIEEARSHYLRALTLVPDSPAYKQNLALTYQSETRKPQK